MDLNPTEGFLLGLAASAGCLVHCLPIVGPAILSTGRPSLRSSAGFMLEFLLGRLVSYAAAGALVSIAGSLVPSSVAVRAANALYVPLGLLLALHVMKESGLDHSACRWLDRNRRWFRTPLFLGLLLGFAPCPPFLLAADSVFGASGAGESQLSPIEGSLFFLFFFAGSSAAIVPWIVAVPAVNLAPVRKIARSVALVAGLFFAFTGLDRTVNSAVREGPKIEKHRERLEELLPEADSFSGLAEAGGVPYVEAKRIEKKTVRDASGRDEEVAESTTLAVCVCTTDLCESRGYGGPVPALLAVSPDGSIAAMIVLEDNQETPSYVSRMYSGAFRDSFLGKKAAGAMVPGKDVDALTGATVTQEALIAGVSESLDLVSSRVLGIESGRAPDRSLAFAASPLPYAALLFFVIAALGSMGALRRFAPESRPGQSAVRYAVMASSTAALGVFAGFYVTGSDIARIFTGRVPDFESAGAWYVLIALFAASALFFGKAYCAWVCPFGALQEILFRIVPFRLEISEAADRKGRLLRAAMLFFWPVAVVIAGSPTVAAVEPLVAAFLWPAKHAPIVAALLAAVLLCSAFVERFYCKYFCIAGCLVDAISRDRLVARPGSCGGCYLGFEGCRFMEEHGETFKARAGRLRGDCTC